MAAEVLSELIKQLLRFALITVACVKYKTIKKQ